MKTAGAIVAVNSNANAQNFEQADYAVDDDVRGVLAMLKRMVEEGMVEEVRGDGNGGWQRMGGARLIAGVFRP